MAAGTGHEVPHIARPVSRMLPCTQLLNGSVDMQPEDGDSQVAVASESRSVQLAGGQPADKTFGFASNSIKTAKYNLITFLPIFLFEMFSRAAYLYFLAQVGNAGAHRTCTFQRQECFSCCIVKQLCPVSCVSLLHKTWTPDEC